MRTTHHMAPLLALLLLAPAQAETVPVRLLALNDFHGHIEADRSATIRGRAQRVGGAAWLATLIRRERAAQPNTLLVEAGDMVGGSPPVSALFQDEPTVEFLNAAGCAVGTLGNHEMDEGMPEALRLWKGGAHRASRYYPKPFPGARFPIVCANLVDARSGKTFFDPFVVKTVNGVKLGFIGAVTTDLPNVVSARSMAGVRQIDPALAINRSVKALQKRGVHAIVVLMHEGGMQREDGPLTGRIVDLVKALDKDVDVVVSAHSHQYTNAFIGKTLVTQARWAGTALARIDLSVDRGSQDIVRKRAEILDVTHDILTPAADVAKLVAGYNKLAAPRINRVVGVTGNVPIGSRGEESPLGNLIADAQREATGADIALMNPGGVRAPLPAGHVTWGQLYAIQPFGNQVVTLKMTGRQIKDVLEAQWGPGSGGEERATVLHPSGLTYLYSPSAPYGQRVMEAAGPDGRPLDDGRTYTVAMNSFLAGGGDGFTMLKGIAARPGPDDLEVLVRYIETHPGVTGATGRVRVLAR